MIYDNDQAVGYIRECVKKFKNNIIDSELPVREDIFSIIERECILLYYPLDDDNIKGCHTRKVLNGKLKHFVFINTIKNVQEQTWTAAHELGHVYGVDRIVNEKLGDKAINAEDIVNRFASEYLFPDNCFIEQQRKVFSDLGIKTSALSKEQFMYVITYMMDYFCGPYKAIIRRFVELGAIYKDNERKYIESFEKNKKYYSRLLKENYFTRLGKQHKACNIEHISSDIKELEELGVLSEDKIKKYRELFKLKEERKTKETFEIGGPNGRGET